MTNVAKFEGKNVDLMELFHRIKGMLVEENFRITKEESTESAHHLRGIKTGVSRIIIGTTRDIEVIVAGEPNLFAVVLVVGAWGKNLVVPSVTGFVVASTVTGPVGLAAGTIAGASSYITAKKFEADMFGRIKKEVEALSRPGQTDNKDDRAPA
jgi:hypothetical protein